MRVDLRNKLVFPDIVQITFRPDIVIWAEGVHTVIIVELTVPWEENCDEAHKTQMSKYVELAEDCELLARLEVACQPCIWVSNFSWRKQSCSGTIYLVPLLRLVLIRQGEHPGTDLLLLPPANRLVLVHEFGG
jgi:hypothetical protein